MKKFTAALVLLFILTIFTGAVYTRVSATETGTASSTLQPYNPYAPQDGESPDVYRQRMNEILKLNSTARSPIDYVPVVSNTNSIKRTTASSGATALIALALLFLLWLFYIMRSSARSRKAAEHINSYTAPKPSVSTPSTSAPQVQPAAAPHAVPKPAPAPKPSPAPNAKASEKEQRTGNAWREKDLEKLKQKAKENISAAKNRGAEVRQLLEENAQQLAPDKDSVFTTDGQRLLFEYACTVIKEFEILKEFPAPGALLYSDRMNSPQTAVKAVKALLEAESGILSGMTEDDILNELRTRGDLESLIRVWKAFTIYAGMSEDPNAFNTAAAAALKAAEEHFDE